MLSEAAAAAYHDYFANGVVPASDVMYIVVILAVAGLALWMARTFVARF
jgi:hypothetical protein